MPRPTRCGNTFPTCRLSASQGVPAASLNLCLISRLELTFELSKLSLLDVECLSSICVKVLFISQNFQVFNNLIELVTSCGNYSQYRKRFSECLGFRFPILGVHLKDLIAVHVALPDWVDKEKTRVNLTKIQQLYAILQELALVQNTPPSIDANTDLLNLLTVSVAETGRANWSLGKEDKPCPTSFINSLFGTQN